MCQLKKSRIEIKAKLITCVDVYEIIKFAANY